MRMHQTLPMDRGIAPLLLVASILFASVAAATPASYSQALNFSTGTQSLWGPGSGTGSFGASGSAGVPSTFFTPALGVGYSFSASSGTASASVDGQLGATFDNHLAAPGSATINLSYTPTSGGFSTNLGARADLTGYVHDIPFYGPWNFCFYCKNWSLQTSSSSTPGFGLTRSDTDAVSVAGVGPDIGVASAQANINATQGANLRLDRFTGILSYTHRDTGTTYTTPFSFAGASVLTANLDMEGMWDFSLLSVDLANTFWSTMGGSLSFDVDVIGLINESWSFASINLLNTGGFDLNFGSKNLLDTFSIYVPEPATGLLLATGLIGLAVAGRRRVER